ncbi:MAG TPA: RecQ family ATP-dependent DNA helicase [Gemmatimonadales bacterium]|jgi:ATP-dependent DNA helicase RecQ
MTSPLAAARHLLQRSFGHADFRPLQSRIIHHVLCGRDVLAVLPTGGGKSLCFQVPALAGDQLTVVVSPLIALMQDQVAALASRQIAAATINSTHDLATQSAILADAAAGRLRMLYLSPERLPRFADEYLARGGRVARLAVDEAHCIVEWGHDFRPSYRGLGRARSALGNPPCIALTGSATPAVRREIRRALAFHPDYREIVGSFDRPNLRFDVIAVSGRDERVSRLVRLIRAATGTCIVYAPTRGLVDGITRILVENGVDAAPYHAGMNPLERSSVLDRFTNDRVRVVVATCAFGMGIDKAAVRLVVHWSMPATPEAYYQEAGRAGRDRAPARCVLLHHPTDAALPRRQLATTFPSERLLEQIWRDPSLRVRQPASVVAAADRLSAELRPDRGVIDWRRTRRRRREAARRIDVMVAYARTRRCRRRELLGWFGERIDRCAGCDRCSPPAR